MLTNIYYYDYYKKYMVSQVEFPVKLRQKRRVRKNSLLLSVKSGRMVILLNKAVKSASLDYARIFFKNVVAFKDAVRIGLRDLEEFNRNIRFQGFEAVRRQLSQDIENFVKTYNMLLDFALSQSHSLELKAYARDNQKLVYEWEGLWKKIGIAWGDNPEISYSGYLDKMGYEDVSSIIRDWFVFFDTLYKKTEDFMTAPLSSHMHFKGLQFYYNYRVTFRQEDTFRIIGAGILMDRAV